MTMNSTGRPVGWRAKANWLGVWAASVFMLASCSLQDRFAFAPDARLAALPDDLDARVLAIETDDSETLVAWQVEAAPNCPTILGFHGNAQHLDSLTPRLKRMAGSGVGYVAVAFRGYSGSSGTPTERGVRLDAEAAYDELISQGLGPEKIVIEGFSLGSSIAVGLAAEKQAGALVLLAPFESGTRLAQQSMRFVPVGLLAGNAFRSDRLAEGVTEPVLILHGSDDGIIPPEHSSALAEHFSNTDVVRKIVPDRQHNNLARHGLDDEYVFPFLTPYFPDCSAFEQEHAQ